MQPLTGLEGQEARPTDSHKPAHQLESAILSDSNLERKKSVNRLLSLRLSSHRHARLNPAGMKLEIRDQRAWGRLCSWHAEVDASAKQRRFKGWLSEACLESKLLGLKRAAFLAEEEMPRKVLHGRCKHWHLLAAMPGKLLRLHQHFVICLLRPLQLAKSDIKL